MEYEQLSKKTKQMINSPDDPFYLLNNYINQNFDSISNYTDAIKYFNKLSSFFKAYNYVPDLDLLIELITKNSIFNKIIEIIFSQFRTQITSGKAEEQFEDSLLLTIDTYCMLNNIEINEPKDINEENYDTSEQIDMDTVKMYLREIGERPLLSAEQERTLAIRVAEGDSKARELFIDSNLKLVVSIAKKYINRGLSLEDLIQEGNIGLIKAVDKFDISKGYKFSTYAAWWIKQEITRAIVNKGRNIRIPVYMDKKVKLYKKTISEMENELGRSPTINEIAKEMGLSISEVVKLDRLQKDTESINAFVDDNQDTELENFISSSEETPEDITIDGTLQSQVRSLFEKCNLKPKEIDVLMLRYGFDDKKPMTLDEIGKQYHLTRERVRQIEAKALMKIRRSKYIKELAIYTDYPEQSLRNIEEFREARTLYKKFLKDNYRTEKRKSENKMKRSQTIYEYFKDYTKEQVDEMLTKLTEEEKALVTIRYGEDLKSLGSTKLTKEQTYKFYGSLIPKMKRLLSNPTGEIKPRKPRQTKDKVQQPVINSETVEETTLVQPEKIERKLIDKLVEPQEQSIEKTTNNNEGITKKDCIKVLELLRTPSFSQLMNTLSVKETVIISLKLGYIDGKYFSTESISEFLGIEPSEVIETTKKVLLVYKDKINSFIDNAILMATDQVGQGETISMKTQSL